LTIYDFGINGVTPSWSQCDNKQAFVEYLQKAKGKINGIDKTMLDYEIENWEG
jgi:hypothetical protein